MNREYKLKPRDEEEKKYLNKRLKIIEGQVRGIAKMIDEDRYCDDILTQLLAINNSIKSVSTIILKSHLSSCVVEEIQNNHLDVIDEIMELIKKLDC